MSIELTMPRLSDTMESGTLLKWNRNEGDEVSAGQSIADIETDKATMEMQVYDDGVIAKLLLDEGETVDVGTPIAILAEEDEDWQEVAKQAGGGASAGTSKGEQKQQKQTQAEGGDEASEGGTATAVAEAPPEEEDEQKKEEAAAPAPQEPEQPEQDQQRQRSGGATSLGPAPESAGSEQKQPKMRVTPVARALAEEHGINLHSLSGSGPAGRIIKRDVLHAIETGEETAAARAPSAQPREEERRAAPTTAISMPAATGAGLEDRKIQLSNMRQTIAKRLVEAKQQIPHYQVTMTFNMDPLLDLRETLNKQLEPQNVKLSVNDFIVRACGLAMYENPEMNASWEDSGIHIHGDINIGIAIALPRERGGGLVVGTLRNADQKALRLISTESKQLAQKARERGLSQEEMSDTTFCISNLGMFGVEHFTAIINPPNSAILAVGGAQEKPVVRHGELTVGTEMQATLSLDHRVIDGAIAAQYLQTLKQMIENPASLLV